MLVRVLPSPGNGGRECEGGGDPRGSGLWGGRHRQGRGCRFMGGSGSSSGGGNGGGGSVGLQEVPGVWRLDDAVEKMRVGAYLPRLRIRRVGLPRCLQLRHQPRPECQLVGAVLRTNCGRHTYRTVRRRQVFVINVVLSGRKSIPPSCLLISVIYFPTTQHK